MLPARDSQTGAVWVIVETSKGQRNKLKFDEEHRVFRLSKVLPTGTVFPFDFGFVPSTRGQDGDPLDVLLLLDEPTPMGCAVMARLIGVIRADQREKGRTVRNDRIIAVATESATHADVMELSQLAPSLVSQIEHFFVSYNAADSRAFRVKSRGGAAAADRVLRAGMRAFGAPRDHAPLRRPAQSRKT